ncbi:hypothetical protein HMPREF9946_01004 [Acetobacteraceae bacterium AT-5844]|nr:hypothetical protein HMPREF9946_01004 [Acetobacteraceae bacterium AT-5844]
MRRMGAWIWRWRRWLRGAALLGVLLAAGGYAAHWLDSRESLLASDPERRASQLTLPPRESAAMLRLNLPIDLLRQAAERALPAEFKQVSAEGADTRYDLTIRRTGGFSLTEAGGKLRVRAPLVVDGTVGLAGGVADFLGLGAKNIDAAADVQADLQVTMDDGWCPVVTMNVSYGWTRSPRLEVIGGIWVGIEAQVREQVEAALRQLPEQLRKLLPCATVREQALELWQPRVIPVQLPAAPPLYIGFHPQSIGLSELVVEPRALRLMLGLRARTTMSSTAPPDPQPTFLPPLHSLPERWAERDGRLRLSLPIRAGYDMVRDWLMREFGERDIPFETPLGTVQLRVKQIFLYPSAPSIAMAVTFSADLPGSWPDTTGEVVFSGRPVLSQGGTRVGLTDIRFSRNLDSAVWSLVTILFEQKIRDMLRDVAVYDLKEVMDGAVAELRRRLADPNFTSGLRVALTEPSIRLEQVVPENDALTVLGTAEAGLEAEITALPIP